MPIETDFAFSQAHSPSGLRTLAAVDLLGPLRGFVGTQKIRKWQGSGFNLIWRPNFGGDFGPQDFFLELNLTDEELTFTDITGTGIANRGLLQKSIFLGGLGYLQTIKDKFDNSDQHFEPGVWANAPATANPDENPTVIRMGSIPHGTTINMQGVGFSAAAPQFDVASITPFQIGSPDDGQTNLVHFPEEKNIAAPSPSRTPSNQVAGLTDQQLANPNLFLSQALAGQTILSTTVLSISSDTSAANSVPNAGGGTDNIAFLIGAGTPPQGGPNANAARVTATFWIERVSENGQEFDQLQYTQRVLLNFNGLSWPHITVATLKAV
jgi:hypothetical protein